MLSCISHCLSFIKCLLCIEAVSLMLIKGGEDGQETLGISCPSYFFPSDVFQSSTCVPHCEEYQWSTETQPSPLNLVVALYLRKQSNTFETIPKLGSMNGKSRISQRKRLVGFGDEYWKPEGLWSYKMDKIWIERMFWVWNLGRCMQRHHVRLQGRG